jgi:hypothetical protein
VAPAGGARSAPTTAAAAGVALAVDEGLGRPPGQAGPGQAGIAGVPLGQVPTVGHQAGIFIDQGGRGPAGGFRLPLRNPSQSTVTKR